MTIQSDLLKQRNLINQGLQDPQIIDKRFLWAQLESLEIIENTASGGGGGGGSGGRGIASLIVRDSGRNPRYFIRQETIDPVTGAVSATLLNLDGTAPNPAPELPLLPGVETQTDELLASIDNKILLIPERVEVSISPSTTYAIDINSISLLSLKVRFGRPAICKLRLVANGQIFGIFNFRPVRSGSGEWAHVLLADRSIDLPTWIPLNSELYNSEDLPIIASLTLSKTAP